MPAGETGDDLHEWRPEHRGRRDAPPADARVLLGSRLTPPLPPLWPRTPEPADLVFERFDAFRLLGDEHVGVEQLADELDEEFRGRR